MSNPPAINPVALIEELRGELAPMLAENGQSYDRLKTVFMIAVQQNPDILKCTPESLRRELSKCAADGLVPDSKEAVLLPYFDNKEKVFLANYQPMVHGVIKRLRELGGVFQIVCNLVYANDIYEENEADPDSLVHRSPGLNEPRGEVVGGYVIFRDEQKRIMHFEKMSREAFDNVRKASKSPNSPAWVKWFEEMCRKVVLRRGSKYLSTNNDKIRALIERQDAMFDLNAKPREERVDPFSGEIIEHQRSGGAIAHQRTETMSMDTGRNQERETVQQNHQEGGQDRREQTSRAQGRQDPGSSNDGQQEGDKQHTKQKAELPQSPPELPDVSIKPDDRTKAIEIAEKALGMALHVDVEPAGRRQNLKNSIAMWKDYLPEYLHPLLKACVDMSDWAIRRDADGNAWAAEHAMFVHKTKTLLDVEKLNVGKYP